MKNATALIAILIAPIFAMAQLGYGPIVGIGAGWMDFEPGPLYTSASMGPVLSGKIGLLFDVNLNNRFYLQTGPVLTLNGDTRNFAYHQIDSFSEAISQTLNTLYADLPVNFVIKSGIQGRGRFFFGLGATPTYIIGGNNKLHAKGVYSGVAYDTLLNTKITPGNPLAGFDIGINIVCGYESPTGFFINAYYTAGVNDIGQGGEVDKNRVSGISAGYFFGKGRNVNKERDDLIDR